MAKAGQEVYSWVEQVLRQQEYAQQGRAARGLLRRYVAKMTGLSRAQVTRLIGRYRASGGLRPHRLSAASLSAALYSRRRGAAGRRR